MGHYRPLVRLLISNKPIWPVDYPVSSHVTCNTFALLLPVSEITRMGRHDLRRHASAQHQLQRGIVIGDMTILCVYGVGEDRTEQIRSNRDSATTAHLTMINAKNFSV